MHDVTRYYVKGLHISCKTHLPVVYAGVATRANTVKAPDIYDATGPNVPNVRVIKGNRNGRNATKARV